jgi:hypothetical protein
VTYGSVGRKNILFFPPTIIKILDTDITFKFVYQCLANLLDTSTEFRYDRNEIIKKNFFFSDEAIIFFGSRRFWWVGRKGETNDILF